MKTTFKLGESEHALQLSRAAHGYRLHLDDKTLAFDLGPGHNHRAQITLEGQTHELYIATRG
ncbi:MAG TPA: acetyl-CoA carboxylase biotin carboxyl carrier protein subunit, partial [Nevskiaceae bacterium]|nr:acetyl-CoA carboxylase biotin carboxyl carrier protein subunit [Nevskiaceae bacterium]